MIHLSHDAGEDTVLIVFVPAMINALLLDSIKTGNDISDGMMDKAVMRWQKTEKLLEMHDGIMNGDVRELCGVSAATASRILAGLVTEGNLVKCRKSGHWIYKLVNMGTEQIWR